MEVEGMLFERQLVTCLLDRRPDRPPHVTDAPSDRTLFARGGGLVGLTFDTCS